MEHKHLPRKSHREKGQTILLVAISLISLLAMAALAIDIVTLYSARSEIQRAADAAALAGAKAIADSGIHHASPVTDPNFTTVKTLAQTWLQRLTNAQCSSANNPVAGVPLWTSHADLSDCESPTAIRRSPSN